MASSIEMPTCDTDGCDTEVVGIDDGWEQSDGTLRCADDWEFWRGHGHWPDEEVENCVECKVAEGEAVRHACPEISPDIILTPGDGPCTHCGEEVFADGQ